MNIGNDRAWNDPPPVLFTPSYQSNPTGPKRTLLNKRVAFPLHKPGGASISTNNEESDRKTKIESIPPGALHPPTESTFSICNNPPTKEESPSLDLTDEEMLSTIQSAFETVLNGFTQVSEEDIAGIKRKLVIFTDSWTESLGTSVKKKMFQLANELSAGNIKAADTLCQSLVVSNTREVTPWMVGVKHIIQNAQKAAPESSDDDHTQQCSEGAPIMGACNFHPDNDLNLES